jgi:hypothetical protein
LYWVPGYEQELQGYEQELQPIRTRIMEGLFAERLTEKPNHGTLAPFIIRYRYRLATLNIL